MSKKWREEWYLFISTPG